MPDRTAHSSEFGPFRYDREQRLLFRGTEPVELTPKEIDLLETLLDRRGQVVEKTELMRRVWPGVTVEESGLARNISTLRKALGDEGTGAGYIETVPKRGYRFAAELRSGPAPRRRAPWGVWVGALVGAVLIFWQFYLPSRYLPGRWGAASLGVLPFEPLGAGVAPEQGRAFQEMIAAEISRGGSIAVTSPSTIRRYQALRIPASATARVLGWDVILEGTVQRQGSILRVTARLADVHSGRLLWGDTFESPDGDRATARTIASAVGALLSRKSST